jgi:hypothetical protein
MLPSIGALRLPAGRLGGWESAFYYCTSVEHGAAIRGRVPDVGPSSKCRTFSRHPVLNAIHARRFTKKPGISPLAAGPRSAPRYRIS